jgi:hypothetical protein
MPASCTSPSSTKVTPGRRPLDHGLAHQDPTGAGIGGDPSGQIHGAAEVVAALDHHRPGRDPDVHRRQPGRRELLHHPKRRQHRPGGIAEVDHHPIAQPLHRRPAVLARGPVDQHTQALGQLGGNLVALLLGQRV